MSQVSDLWNIAKTILSGITQSEETSALQAVVNDVEKKVSWETITFDAAKALLPQFALYLDIAQIVVIVAPNTTPADWDAAVIVARSRNPYSAGYVMGQGGD